jgi:hypothetical protein
MTLGDHEQMCRRFGSDVADRDEPVSPAHVVALAVEPAEEAVVRQRGSSPRRGSYATR